MSRTSAGRGWRAALPRLGVAENSPLPIHHLATRLAAIGERAAALGAYQELVAAAPDDLHAHEALAGLLAQMGRYEESAAVERQVAAITVARMGVPEAEREAAIAYRLAMLGLAPVPTQVPGGYVAALFDAYAERFDAHLCGQLAYRGPEIVEERVARALGAPEGRLDVCDIGCGTGLFGPRIRPWARRLDGVDRSAGMLAQARARGVYDALVEGDLVEALASRPGAYDLITAVDVLIYFGDLGAAFAAAAAALKPGGLLAFTVERIEQGEYQLGPGGRYQHTLGYLRGLAAGAGLDEVIADEVVLRVEQARPVEGLALVLRKTR